MSEEPLFDLWRRQFIAELQKRARKADEAAASAKTGGYYAQQLLKAADMYEAALAAVQTTQKPPEIFEGTRAALDGLTVKPKCPECGQAI